MSKSITLSPEHEAMLLALLLTTTMQALRVRPQSPGTADALACALIGGHVPALELEVQPTFRLATVPAGTVTITLDVWRATLNTWAATGRAAGKLAGQIGNGADYTAIRKALTASEYLVLVEYLLQPRTVVQATA